MHYKLLCIVFQANGLSQKEHVALASATSTSSTEFSLEGSNIFHVFPQFFWNILQLTMLWPWILAFIGHCGQISYWTGVVGDSEFLQLDFFENHQWFSTNEFWTGSDFQKKNTNKSESKQNFLDLFGLFWDLHDEFSSILISNAQAPSTEDANNPKQTWRGNNRQSDVKALKLKAFLSALGVAIQPSLPALPSLALPGS